jgi:hypothetical protein
MHATINTPTSYVHVQGKAQFHVKKSTAKSAANSKNGGLAAQLKGAWHTVMFVFIGLFAVSCIEQFAQMK